jgi:hypothetical protein
VASLGASACSNLTPAENAGVFGTTGGIAAGAIARAAGMSTAGSIATGVAAGALIGATTYIIAKHEASVRQRQIADTRARAAFKRMSAERRRTAPAQTSSRSPLKAEKIPRYIAVDTVKDEHTSPRARKSVMIWDTQSEQVVGNGVYDVQTPPPVGSTARFETYSAQYVGSGS